MAQQPTPASQGAQTGANAPPVEERARFWSKLTHSYTAHPVAPVSLANSNRLESLMRAGIIYLSLSDAIALALENNLDIEIQRYGPQIARADLLRAQAGAAIRGVSTATAQGSSGATGTSSTGTTQSATNLGGGSVGTGLSFDPVISSTYQWSHRTSPQTNTVVTGLTALVSRNISGNASYTQSFLTGTTTQFTFSNFNQLQNSFLNAFNPSTATFMDLQVTQPLLQGFGIAINNRNIRIARNNLKVADLVFKQQVITTVANIVTLYWDLVSFNEDVKVKRQALALSQKLYEDNKKQVEIGTLAPIEIVRAEAEVASRQQDLTTSETNVLQQETIIKNALSRTGMASPSVSEARIVPTDSIRIPQRDEFGIVSDLVTQALSSRPELAQSQIQIDNARISLTGTKNALLPTLNAFASARNNGLAGQVNTIPAPNGQPVARSVDSFFLGGYSDALGQVFRRNFPDYAYGVSLNIPVRNRAAQADYASAQLNLRQSELQIQRQANNIRVDVQNAVIALQQARARHEAAQKNRILQEQTLDAEQKKYALGASTLFLVIQSQRDLANAQGSEVVALATYSRARVQLQVATGQVLESNNVLMDEAQKGLVSRPPTPLPPPGR